MNIESEKLLSRRLVLERVYSTACLVMATNSPKTLITQPAEDLSFQRFVAARRLGALSYRADYPAHYFPAIAKPISRAALISMTISVVRY